MYRPVHHIPSGGSLVQLQIFQLQTRYSLGGFREVNKGETTRRKKSYQGADLRGDKVYPSTKT